MVPKRAQGSPDGVAKVLRARRLGRRSASVEMRLVRRMSRGKRTFLFRLSPVHRARHREYSLLGELSRFHRHSIQRRDSWRWSILLFLTMLVRYMRRVPAILPKIAHRPVAGTDVGTEQY
jgi:hypothetical protein